MRVVYQDKYSTHVTMEQTVPATIEQLNKHGWGRGLIQYKLLAYDDIDMCLRVAIGTCEPGATMFWADEHKVLHDVCTWHCELSLCFIMIH